MLIWVNWNSRRNWSSIMSRRDPFVLVGTIFEPFKHLRKLFNTEHEIEKLRYFWKSSCILVRKFWDIKTTRLCFLTWRSGDELKRRLCWVVASMCQSVGVHAFLPFCYACVVVTFDCAYLPPKMPTFTAFLLTRSASEQNLLKSVWNLCLPKSVKMLFFFCWIFSSLRIMTSDIDMNWKPFDPRVTV